MATSVESLVQLIAKSGLRDADKLAGHSVDEILSFQDFIGAKLPLIYIDYLSTLGKINPGLSDYAATSTNRIISSSSDLAYLKSFLHSKSPLLYERGTIFFFAEEASDFAYFLFESGVLSNVFVVNEAGYPEDTGLCFLDYLKELMTRIINLRVQLANRS